MKDLEQNVNTKDYAIVIMSCDSYSDIWPHFSNCWELFWPECPFEAFLVSEQKAFIHPSIQNIQIGRRVGWSDMLINVLGQLSHPHVIYMQEDYLLKSHVKFEELRRLLGIFEQQKATYLRLFPWPNPSQLLDGHLNIGVIHKDTPYRTSLQCAVWNKEALKSLLVAGESGWDFEHFSVSRSSTKDYLFLGLYSDLEFAELNNGTYPIDYFASGVLNGKWMRECLQMFRKKGIKINPGKRGVLSHWDYFYYQHKKSHKNLLFYFLDKYLFRSALFNVLHFYFLRLFGKV